ncbi:MAG: hypothetical protein ABW092_13165 [Candidatus Thiodiazotropha sp.]
MKLGRSGWLYGFATGPMASRPIRVTIHNAVQEAWARQKCESDGTRHSISPPHGLLAAAKTALPENHLAAKPAQV